MVQYITTNLGTYTAYCGYTELELQAYIFCKEGRKGSFYMGFLLYGSWWFRKDIVLNGSFFALACKGVCQISFSCGGFRASGWASLVAIFLG